MKIILTGGGTIGSVSPLIAIKQELEKQKIQADYLWVGTETGIEKNIIDKQNIPYKAIKSAKLRRYFSGWNFLVPFQFLVGWFQSLKIIIKFKPDIILSAGSFVCVPVVLAGWLLKKKTVIHQQDFKVGLANRIMAPFSSKVTATFEKSVKDFSSTKTQLTGNPVRQEIFSGSKEKAMQLFNLQPDLPTLLIMGGSLGATRLNKLIFEAVPELVNICQIIHITGKGQEIEWVDKEKFGEKANRYHSIGYLYKDLVHAYAAADLTVCRAGMSTLTELTALRKAMLLVPIPDNQQEENARFFDSKNAVILMDQKTITADQMVTILVGLLSNPNSLQRLQHNLGSVMLEGANEKYVEFITSLIKKKK